MAHFKKLEAKPKNIKKSHLNRVLITCITISTFLIAILFTFYKKNENISQNVFRYIVKFKTKNFTKNKVLKCLNGWYFFEPELTYITSSINTENVRSIAAFDSILRLHGMILYVLPIPNKIEIYPENFTFFPVPPNVKPERDRFIGELNKTGVRVIDIIPAFKNAKRKKKVFDPYDTHWTSVGIELAAQVIAEKIDSALDIKKISRNTNYIVHDTLFKTCADMRERTYGKGKSEPYPLQIRQVICEDGRYYCDDKNSNVMILGDSFADRGRWWYAHLGAHLARFIRHPTRTWFTLKANGEGPHMYTHKPNMFPENGIVIWAFTSRVLQYKLKKP